MARVSPDATAASPMLTAPGEPCTTDAFAATMATTGHTAPTQKRGDRQPMTLTVMGATGSIGTSTLDLVARNPEAFVVDTLTAGSNAKALAALAIQHGARRAVVADPASYDSLKAELSGTGIEAAAGLDALLEVGDTPVDCVMAAIVGAAGLPPVFRALRHGRRVALANKECLVCAGDVFMAEARAHGVELLPVDSEHSAGFQALGTWQADTIEKLILTASGGPFRTWSAERIAAATREEALNHPNWSMGAKITIDSASMMNKGLELIEAYHLFPISADQLDVVVHPQSIVHCLVSYCDGSVLAQLSEPDMRTPIALALSWPTRMCAPTKPLDLAQIATLTFEAPDEQRFPALRMAKEALRRGGGAPAVLNAANEVAVFRFLQGGMRFSALAETVDHVMDRAEKAGLCAPPGGLDDILALDAEARRLASEHLAPTA